MLKRVKCQCATVLAKHLYLIWGIVVVGVVTLLTGAFISSVVGYTAVIGVKEVVEKIISI